MNLINQDQSLFTPNCFYHIILDFIFNTTTHNQDDVTPSLGSLSLLLKLVSDSSHSTTVFPLGKIGIHFIRVNTFFCKFVVLIIMTIKIFCFLAVFDIFRLIDVSIEEIDNFPTDISPTCLF